MAKMAKSNQDQQWPKVARTGQLWAKKAARSNKKTVKAAGSSKKHPKVARNGLKWQKNGLRPERKLLKISEHHAIIENLGLFELSISYP